MKEKIERQLYDNNTLSKIGPLYKTYYRQLYLYALTFLDDDDEAKDVVNDAFVKIWTDWQKGVCREDTLLGYLYRIIRNLCLDILRHRKVQDKYVQMKMATEEMADVSNTDVISFEKRITSLRKAVDDLPEPDRTILKCCYFKKYSYKQTAEELQITINVVHKRMVNAFKILRKMLNSVE
ncbi:MAG: RNA polymerase sigma-70 factor [Prevotella sp.]|nr:RNA polymerase sigma-70 factor [Prevotella sp.]